MGKGQFCTEYLKPLVGSFVRTDTEDGILRAMSVLYLSRRQVPGSSASVPATTEDAQRHFFV